MQRRRRRRCFRRFFRRRRRRRHRRRRCLRRRRRRRRRRRLDLAHKPVRRVKAHAEVLPGKPQPAGSSNSGRPNHHGRLQGGCAVFARRIKRQLEARQPQRGDVCGNEVKRARERRQRYVRHRLLGLCVVVNLELCFHGQPGAAARLGLQKHGGDDGGFTRGGDLPRHAHQLRASVEGRVEHKQAVAPCRPHRGYPHRFPHPRSCRCTGCTGNVVKRAGRHTRKLLQASAQHGSRRDVGLDQALGVVLEAHSGRVGRSIHPRDAVGEGNIVRVRVFHALRGTHGARHRVVVLRHSQSVPGHHELRRLGSLERAARQRQGVRRLGRAELGRRPPNVPLVRGPCAQRAGLVLQAEIGGEADQRHAHWRPSVRPAVLEVELPLDWKRLLEPMHVVKVGGQRRVLDVCAIPLWVVVDLGDDFIHLRKPHGGLGELKVRTPHRKVAVAAVHAAAVLGPVHKRCRVGLDVLLREQLARAKVKREGGGPVPVRGAGAVHEEHVLERGIHCTLKFKFSVGYGIRVTVLPMGVSVKYFISQCTYESLH